VLIPPQWKKTLFTAESILVCFVPVIDEFQRGGLPLSIKSIKWTPLLMHLGKHGLVALGLAILAALCETALVFLRAKNEWVNKTGGGNS
jgi:hypothetical protein